MEEQFKRLASVVSRVLNISEAAVADAVESDEAVKSLTTQFKEYRTAQDTAGYQRAEQKLKTDVEKALKTRGVEGAAFDKLTEGLEILEQKARDKSGAQLSDEEVLNHPAVVKLKNQHAVEKEQIGVAAKTEAEKALGEQVKAFRKEQDQAVLDGFARKWVRDLNPVLSQDADRAANQFEDLVDRIKKGDWKVVDGKPVPLKPGTEEYLTDDMGHPVKAEDIVRGTVTKYHDLPVSNPRESAGHEQSNFNGKGNQPQLQHFKGKLPETQDEYLKLANDTEQSYEARKELKGYWEAKGGQ